MNGYRKPRAKTVVICSIISVIMCGLILAFIFREWVEFRYYSFRFMIAEDYWQRVIFADELADNRYGLRFLLECLHDDDEDVVFAALQGLSDRLSDAGMICNLLIADTFWPEIKGFRKGVAGGLSCCLGMVRQNIGRIVRCIKEEDDPQQVKELGVLLNISTMGLFPFSVEDSPSDIKERAVRWWETNKDLIEEKDIFSKGEEL